MSAIVGALRVTLGIDTSAFSAGLAGAQKSLAGVGKRMQDVGKSLALSVSAPVAGFGGLALKTAGDFEAAMNRVGAAAGATGDELSQMESLAQKLGVETQFSAVEAAGAIEMLAKNGLDASQILGGALEASLKLAASSGSDLASSADLATDVMANFNKTAGDLGGVVDGVAGVLLESKFGFDDYRLAIAQAGGVAGGLGVSLEDFNAAIAATSSAFASGSDAGTSFKTFLQTLVPKSADAEGAMKELGLEFFDAQGNMKSMADIAQELQDGLRGLSDEARTDALSTIFGTDAMRTAIGLASEGAAGIRDLSAAIGEASANEQAAARMAGFNGEVEKLKSAFEGLMLAIGNSGLLETATNFTVKLTEIVSALAAADPALLKFGVVVAGVGAAVGPVLIGLGLLAAAVGAISLPVAAVVAGVALLTAGLIAFWPEVIAAKDAVIAFGTQALDWIKAKPAEIAEAFKAIVANMKQIGVDIMAGLWSGLTERWEGIKTRISEFASSIGSIFREETQTQSPSKVMEAVGSDIMQGLGVGLQKEQPAIEANLRSFAAGLSEAFGGVNGLPQTKEQLDQLAYAAQSVFEGTRTPQERFTAEMQKLNTLLQLGAIDFQTYERATMNAQDALNGIAETGTSAFGDLGEAFSSTVQGMITGTTTLKDSLLGLLSQIGGNMMSAGLNGLFKGFKIPGFAAGTPFAPGGLALVGEKGPELVSLPRGSRVTPNHRLGGMAPVFNINVNGARGNTEIREMVAAGVSQGMNQVRREVPGIVSETQKRRG